MASMGVARFSCLVLLYFLQLPIPTTEAADADPRQEYIVYMGQNNGKLPSIKGYHLGMLKDVLGSKAPECLLYSYGKSFNGFLANVTDAEANRFKEMEGVVSVFPNRRKQLQTTRSWDFMGFPLEVARNNRIESDIVVGVLDTGIWPYHPSFSDEGYGPPPAKWKGTCQTSPAFNFTCNRKIIGARYFNTSGAIAPHDLPSPVDVDGHGTHTASTVSGGVVRDASFMGLASGAARGGVPSARIAVYKVCWLDDGCWDSDILAGFDAAIADGVDVISISIGSSFAESYFRDSIAIGSFHAMRHGILTSASGGNSGPSTGTISNVAPWFLSVAASTIDRKFITKVQLGNGKTYQGISRNTFDLHSKSFPLVYGGTAQNFSQFASSSRFCSDGSLNATMVKGKIILCDALSTARGPFLAGAVGAIMDEKSTRLDSARSFPLPASFVGIEDGIDIFSYITSSSNPVGTIMKSNELKDPAAPFVISFSSRGPNIISPGILKPDIAAPGVDIIAAWSALANVTDVEGDNRKVSFNIISGTSMACPHATATAAYIKTFHPTWSPSAIKSAIMTTAFRLNASKTPKAEFAYGSGHINPTKAVDPGLVYDAEEIDYVNFLCSQGLNSTTLQLTFGTNHTCDPKQAEKTGWDLNYPSFALPTNTTLFSRVFHRTVTNVGAPVSTYSAQVISPQGLSISVKPSELSFKSVGEKASFEVVVRGTINATDNNAFLSSALLWSDGMHLVRSPIVVYVSSFI